MKIIEHNHNFRLFQFDENCIALEYLRNDTIKGIKIYNDVKQARNEFHTLCENHNMELSIEKQELDILVAYRSGSVPPLLL